MARVFVIDDDLGTREIFEFVLRKTGHDVRTAESGRQALELIDDEWPDVAFVDFNLLDMTALDVLHDLRAHKINTPCIIMTGYGTIESAVSAMKMGAVDYLTKPVEADELERALANALGSRPSSVPAIVRADGLTRWALAIASVIDASRDPKHLADWGRIRGVAPETLRSWCRTATISPKDSLDLARVLRAVSQGRSRGWAASTFLEVADHRTLARLRAKGGFQDVGAASTIEDVLTRQTFIQDGAALEELRRVLREFGVHVHQSES